MRVVPLRMCPITMIGRGKAGCQQGRAAAFHSAPKGEAGFSPRG